MARAERSLPPNYQAVLDVIEHAGPGSHLSGCSSCGSLRDLAYEVPTTSLAELGQRHDCTIDTASV